MKKYMLAFLSLIVLFITTGCNGDSSTNADANDNTVITMWMHMSDETPEGQHHQARVDAFNERYADEGVEAVVQFIPRAADGAGYEDQVNAAVSAGTLPDIITVDGPNTAAFASNGILAPITDFITDIDDLLPTIIEQGTYNGEMYVLGMSETSVGIFYNIDMFEEAGIDIDSLPTVDNPWTYDEFLEISAILTAHFGGPAIDLQLNSGDEMITYGLSPFVWSSGGEIISEDGTQADGIFNSNETLEAMTFLQTLVREGFTTIAPVERGFETEVYPMFLSGVWTAVDLDTNFDINYGIMPFPVSPTTGELASPSGGWGVGMTATSENQEWAGRLVDWMANTESNVGLVREIGILPNRHSSSEIVRDELTEQIQVLLEQLTVSGRARPVTPAYPEITRAFQNTVEDISFYEENPDIMEVLNLRAAEMQEALERANR